MLTAIGALALGAMTAWWCGALVLRVAAYAWWVFACVALILADEPGGDARAAPAFAALGLVAFVSRELLHRAKHGWWRSRAARRLIELRAGRQHHGRDRRGARYS